MIGPPFAECVCQSRESAVFHSHPAANYFPFDLPLCHSRLNVTALTQELTAAGNKDFAIKVFPDANHDGFETTDLMLDGEQMRYLRRLAPGLVNTQITWVLAHVRTYKAA